MYWTDNGSGDIMRANLDGSGQQILITGLPLPSGIALSVGAPVPEPSTVLLLAIGTLGLLLGYRPCAGGACAAEGRRHLCSQQ
jgi:hypothetical protein